MPGHSGGGASRPVEVDAHDALPEVEVEVVPGRGLEDGCVVDEDVERAEFVGDPCAKLFDRGWVADVELVGECRAAGTG
jgi:hypothetical protein